jgi:hypothetical protein
MEALESRDARTTSRGSTGQTEPKRYVDDRSDQLRGKGPHESARFAALAPIDLDPRPDMPVFPNPIRLVSWRMAYADAGSSLSPRACTIGILGKKVAHDCLHPGRERGDPLPQIIANCLPLLRIVQDGGESGNDAVAIR